MKPVSITVAGKVSRFLCGLALVALILSGGAYTHLNAVELGNHSHEGVFAAPEDDYGNHRHAGTDGDLQFDVAAIHCGSDLLGLTHHSQLNVSCRTAFGTTRWGMGEPAIAMIEPPPPRTDTFAL